MNLSRFIGELKRRNVFRVAVMYGAAAVGILAVASDVAGAMDLPGWVPRAVIFVTVLGFPLALVLAWAFDLTPQGVTRAEEPEPLPAAPAPAVAVSAGGGEAMASRRGGAGTATLAVRVPKIMAPPPAPRPEGSSGGAADAAEAAPPDPERVKRAALASVWNELRAPTHGILGYSEMLLEDAAGRAPEEALADLRKIQAAGKQLLALVDDTLHPDRVSVAEIERDAEGFGAKLRHDLRNPINAIIGYSEMLVESSEEDGHPELVPDLQRVLSSARHLLRLTHDIVRFSGRETESGGESAEISRAEAIVRGALARIRPLTPDTFQLPEGQPGTLLVVDDNATNRDLLSRQLARQGYTVSTAQNGREALEMLRTQDFDLVLLDILMPEVNGIEVLQQVKGDPGLRDIPVIMISALDEIASVVRCIEMGAEDYLSKPFDPVLLGTRIGASLQLRRLRDRERLYAEEMERARAAVDRALCSLCPAPFAARVGAGETGIAEAYPETTVVVAEVEGIAKVAARNGPAEVVRHLGALFSAFDRVAEESGIETLKTFGPTYVAAVGVPTPRADHARAAADAALAMLRETGRYAAESGEPFRVRVGLHTGPVAAGVLDTGRLSFDLWGDAVDGARSMGASGVSGAVQASAASYARLRDEYVFESRGVMEVPGKGQMRTYLLQDRKGGG